MLRAGVAAVLGLALAACPAERKVILAPPEGVVWFAVASEGGAGASGIVPWAAGAALPVIAEGTPVIYGWTEDVLAGAGAPTTNAAALREVHLQAAEGCTPAVPPPTWAVRARADGGFDPLDPAAVPRFTASWVDASCPALSPGPLAVNASCGEHACEATATALEGCDVEIDLTACGAGKVRGRRGARSCVDLDAWRCETQDAEPPAVLLQRCDRPRACRIELFPPPPATPPFDLRAASIGAAAAYLPAELRAESRLLPERLYAGPALDLLVLGDRVLITRIAGPAENCAMSGPATTTLHVLDADTLATVTTSVTPYRCLSGLMADPADPTRWIGVHESGGRWWLTRFERTGRALDTALLEDEAFAANTRVVGAAALGTPRGPGYLLEFTRERMVSGGFLLVHRLPDTLARDRRWLFGSGRLWHAEPYDESSFAAGTELGGQLGLIDINRGAAGAVIDLATQYPRDRRDIAGVAVHAATGRVLVLTTWQEPAIDVVDPAASASIGELRYFRPGTLPTRAAEWPRGGATALVAGTRARGDGTWEAVASTADAAAARLLPGEHTIGDGAVSKIAVDAKGRAWLLLPWSAKVVRLDPKVSP